LIDLITSNPSIKDILIQTYNLKNKRGTKKCFLQYKKDTALPIFVYDSINSTYYILMEIYKNILTKYGADDILSISTHNMHNMYYCNYKMFDEDGNIVKKSKKELDGRKKFKLSNKKKKSLKKKR
jgi:hypothetical protein